MRPTPHFIQLPPQCYLVLGDILQIKIRKKHNSRLILHWDFAAYDSNSQHHTLSLYTNLNFINEYVGNILFMIKIFFSCPFLFGKCYICLKCIPNHLIILTWFFISHISREKNLRSHFSRPFVVICVGASSKANSKGLIR